MHDSHPESAAEERRDPAATRHGHRGHHPHRNKEPEEVHRGTPPPTQQEITELKDLLNQIEKKFRDPESKTKIKQLKADAQKQIERNKIILKELINR